MRRLAALLMATVALLLAAPPASAQQQYPPAGGTGTRDFGAQRPGETFPKEDCGFAPGTTAQVSLNGTNVLTKTVEADGCVRLSVQVESRDRVRIDGQSAAARDCAQNVIRVSGTHRDGGTLAFNNLFSIDCRGIAGTAASRGGTGTARTGFETAGYVGGAALLLGTGAALLVIGRRRRHDDAQPSAA